LPHAAFGIRFGLALFHTALTELFVEDSDLLVSGTQPGLSLRNTGAGLILARPDLCIIEDGDHIARLHQVALAEIHLEQAAAGFTRNRRIVAFHSAAQTNHVGGLPGLSEEHAPNDGDSDGEDKNARDEDKPPGTPRLFGLPLSSVCVCHNLF
jgi:hypothetical protein